MDHQIDRHKEREREKERGAFIIKATFERLSVFDLRSRVCDIIFNEHSLANPETVRNDIASKSR